MGWADVTGGDVVEVHVFDMQQGWQWERREVLGVDRGGGEDAAPCLIVQLRDPDGEHDDYEIDGLTDAHAIRWPDVPIEEDPDGQQRIGGPDTDPTFSTDAGGSPPHEAELAIKAKKIEWPTDLRRGSSVLLLVWAYVDEVRVASQQKTFVAEIGRQMVVEHPTMRPHEVLDALAALESRPRRDRAVIDQAAKLAAELVDAAGGIVDLDVAVAMRERLYDRFGVDDDAVEVTHGTPDHEEGLTVERANAIVVRALRNVEMSAREVDALFAGDVTQWTLDGRKLTRAGGEALLSLHDHLNDLAHARTDPEDVARLYRRHDELAAQQPAVARAGAVAVADHDLAPQGAH